MAQYGSRRYCNLLCWLKAREGEIKVMKWKMLKSRGCVNIFRRDFRHMYRYTSCSRKRYKHKSFAKGLTEHVQMGKLHLSKSDGCVWPSFHACIRKPAEIMHRLLDTILASNLGHVQKYSTILHVCPCCNGSKLHILKESQRPLVAR